METQASQGDQVSPKGGLEVSRGVHNIVFSLLPDVFT